jgi:hypothetical protein
MFLKLLIISLIFLAISAAGLGIRMILKANASFPDTHVSSNPEMQKRGLSCAQQTDTGCHSSEGFPGCAACSGHRL